MTAPAPVLPLGVAPQGLTRSAQALYGTLARLARTRDSIARGYVEVGMSQLTKRTQYSERMLRYARAELADAGLIEVLRVGDGRKRSWYRVDVSGPVQSLPPRAATNATQGGTDCHPQRARAGSSRLSSRTTPIPPEPTALGAALDALKCPTARLRGRRCARCRACGTSPRVLAAVEARPARPAWCGECDEATRLQLDDHGYPEPGHRCARCHPLAVDAAARAGP
jgi:DNA-binding transcriptional ArsR family regulator